ncbi:MAG: serine/threonine protein kinase [Verrucomicrobia bacterium]|nr:MAG: serine/threonine protein kinase [Verrucomicrobiota bacterium]
MNSETEGREIRAENFTPAEIEALLFSAAMSFDAAEDRARFLGFACRDQPDLLLRIKRWTEGASAAEEFFEFENQIEPLESMADLPSDAEGIGVQVGRYRLIERLGSGGCGVVYLAEQEKPVRRKVALKIIRVGLETPEAIARFELERQALASMNHPNIARILDAGTHASGRPFFVMELVDGESITHYCDARHLSIRDRLQLFVQVCQAIQHAHQKGVIHRDIKPSNVLVETHESQPVPKIIDFGIAQEIDRAGPTGLAGSPLSMSPEQVCGMEAVDTRSDIYSLGMLLAELLAGPHRHLPENLMDRPFEEIRHILTKYRPNLPSESLTARPTAELLDIARHRNIAPEVLKNLCRNELDWLVAKAIQTEPSQRYDTATVLAADVLRWLHGEAITARPPTRRYRLAKLMGRNRLLFGAAALAFVGLLGGLSIATVLFLREKDARAAEARLRTQAVAAHQAEILARQRAEHQSRVAESAVRLRYGDFEGAEKLIAPIPIAATPPSLESTSVYKSLAEWHRAHGRIESAELRFLGMIHALARIDRSHTDANSDLFLPAAALLARSSKPERYAELRRIALDLYTHTRDRLIAERILKVCLLKPLPPEELEQTAKMVAFLESIAPQQPEGRLLGWESFSIALHYYRMADFRQAELWARRSLECPEYADRNVPSSQAVLGLIWRKRGDEAKALEFLLPIATKYREPLQSSPIQRSIDPLWYDWSNLKTIMEEAGWKDGEFSQAQ